MGMRASLFVGLVAIAVAGCGSSAGSPSQLNPAQIAPAKSVLYVDLTVRPQGSESSGAESGLTKLLGHSPDADIQRAVASLFKQSGLNYKRDVQPWLGERIGIVLTAFSTSGFGVIAPTNNPKAALATLKRGEKNAGLTSQSYDGVSYEQGVDDGTPEAIGIVSHDAVVASPATFKQIVDASRGSSLLSQSSFASAFGGLPTSSLVRAYVNGPAAASALRSIPSLSPAVRQELRTALGRGKLPNALSLALSVSPTAIAAQVHETPTYSAKRSTADVSHLPGESWLALSTGTGPSKNLTKSFDSSLLGGLNRSVHGVNPSTLLNIIQQRIGINIQRDLIPALGGFQLALQGDSLLTVGAGLELHPTDPQAAVRLLGEIRNLVARVQSLQVTGGSKSFTITKSGLPIPRIVVADLGREVLATVDEPSFQTLLAPATTLATNPAFERARSELVPGSVVPLFLNFGPLATLLSQTPQFQGQSGDAKALATLRKLDYLVFGLNPAAGVAQLVLGLH